MIRTVNMPYNHYLVLHTKDTNEMINLIDSLKITNIKTDKYTVELTIQTKLPYAIKCNGYRHDIIKYNPKIHKLVSEC